MKLTKVTVTASRTFNHPFERFANFRFSITLEGEIEEGLSIQPQIDALREEAEINAENHKRQILADLDLIQERDSLVGTIRHLEHLSATREQIAAKATDESLQDWVKENAERALEELDRLPELRAKLEAMPKPKLIPEPEIHPGHKDHPATDFSL
jgi:hypothetical protein